MQNIALVSWYVVGTAVINNMIKIHDNIPHIKGVIATRINVQENSKFSSRLVVAAGATVASHPYVRVRLHRSLVDTDLIHMVYFDNFRLRNAFAYHTNQNKCHWCPGDSRSQNQQGQPVNSTQTRRAISVYPPTGDNEYLTVYKVTTIHRS